MEIYMFFGSDDGFYGDLYGDSLLLYGGYYAIYGDLMISESLRI